MSKRTFRITLSIMAAVLFALIGMNISLDNEKTWDVSYEMANTHVSWLQTFHGGAWNSDENKGTYHPRKLYRGLTVPYSTAPGRKRIHPKPARENVK